jgi:hypothetical protein
MAGKRPLTGHQLSDFGLLGHLERVIYLDTKVSNGVLEPIDIGVAYGPFKNASSRSVGR